MKEDDHHKDDTFSVAETNIEDVKRKNAQSGMSYNEALEYIAKTIGGHGTGIYSDTDATDVKMENEQSAKNQKN